MAYALGIDASPRGGGRTATALHAILEAARGGEDAEVVSLADVDVPTACEQIERASIVIFGTPTYRASYTWTMKALLDGLPRGMWGEDRDPLRGKAVGIVATGATLHHFLALDELRNVLVGFFAAHVLPPGLYVPQDGFAEDGSLVAPYDDAARAQGAGLRALAEALAASERLRAIRPHA